MSEFGSLDLEDMKEGAPGESPPFNHNEFLRTVTPTIPPESEFIRTAYDRMIATEGGRLLAPVVEWMSVGEESEFFDSNKAEIAYRLIRAIENEFGLCPSWQKFSVGLGETEVDVDASRKEGCVQ